MAVLVTGSHRSGTTWVGRMLALPESVCYVDEPFNVDRRSRWFRTPFDLWFTYVTRENEGSYYRTIERVVGLRYDWRYGLQNCRSLADLRRVARDSARLLQRRWSGQVPLIKDPIAVLSSEWLHERFGVQVVVMIRHPAAFAGSLKTKGWKYPFSHFLRQPLLMADHLGPFEAELREFVEHERDVVDQAALEDHLRRRTQVSRAARRLALRAPRGPGERSTNRLRSAVPATGSGVFG
jgi:hypothetical protein